MTAFQQSQTAMSSLILMHAVKLKAAPLPVRLKGAPFQPGAEGRQIKYPVSGTGDVRIPDSNVHYVLAWANGHIHQHAQFTPVNQADGLRIGREGLDGAPTLTAQGTDLGGRHPRRDKPTPASPRASEKKQHGQSK